MEREDRFLYDSPKGFKCEIDGKHYVSNEAGELVEVPAPRTSEAQADGGRRDT